jgi:hypothetical protein
MGLRAAPGAERWAEGLCRSIPPRGAPLAALDLLEVTRLETSQQSDFRLAGRAAREMDFDGARLGSAQGSRVICGGLLEPDRTVRRAKSSRKNDASTC